MNNLFFNKIRNELNNNSLHEALITRLVPIFEVSSLKNDLVDIENETNVESVKNYRDWKVAHIDYQKWDKLNLDLEKLNKTINLLHEKILKYELRLNGVGYPDSGLLPTITYDWESIFKIPWIK